MRKRKRFKAAIWGLICLAMLGACDKKTGGEEQTPGKVNEALRLKFGDLKKDAKPDEKGEISFLAIICDRDESKRTFTVTSIKDLTLSQSDYNMDGKEYLLSYTGGTNISNEYDNAISQAQLHTGEIVRVVYDSKADTIKTIKRVVTPVMYKNLSDYSVSKSDRKISVGAKDYRFDEGTLIFDKDERVTSSILSEYDEITIYGDEKRIYSIIINKGHGTIKLTGYNQFIGGYIDVGPKVMKVVENMEITCTEGSYRVILTKDDNTAVKNVTVKRDETVKVAFDEFIKSPTLQGGVTFKVSPSDARVYVDGAKVDHTKTLQLDYGTHTVTVVCDGYDKYIKNIIVDTIHQEIVLDVDGALAEAKESSSSSSAAAETTSQAATESTSQSETKSTI